MHMETQHTTEPSQTPSMDIHAPQREAHHSRKIVITLSILLVILATAWILIQSRTRRDYLPTPEEQMQLLRDSSEPVTTTIIQQKAQLDALEKSSVPNQASREALLQELELLGQKK